MKRKALILLSVVSMGWSLLRAQTESVPPETKQAPMASSGQVVIDGKSNRYLVRRLPVSSFPELPTAVQDLLNRRGCMIPQTYEAHHPENVIHARLERPESSDWAVLCSVRGMVTLLVFFGSGPAQPFELASAPELERLQAHGSDGMLGFNWAIDPGSPEKIHESQSGMERRPAVVDHDAVADSVVDHSTIYHFYAKHAWTLLDVPN